MAASGADNMQTELSADDAALQPPYQGHPKAPVSAQATETSVTDERKRQAARRPTAQRVRTVRLTTQVHPDMLVPYLYGERGGRSINAIVNATGCTIDYCALSPDEPERSPQSHGYAMNFLVSAGSSEMLEDATRQLRKLVDRVQVHLQTKARSRPRGREETEVDDMRQHSYEAGGRRGMMSPRLSEAEASAAVMVSKREAIPDERWTNGEPEEDWDVPMQRVYYAPRVRRERPIYMEVTDVDADEKKLLGKLDSYLENLFTESEQTLEERVVVLQAGLERVLATDGLPVLNRVVKTKPAASRHDNIPNSKSCTPPRPIEQNHDKSDDAVGMDWEDDGWFEESAPTDPVSDEDQENFVAHISPKKSNLKFEGDFLAVKLEEGASPRWPRELPPFVWSLLARVISSDPQSYVMRATHKRLMAEIAKGDPYYYLHPTIISKDTDMSSPSPSSPSQPCEFGCRGASALKWERKLVSQISSRMKSFDNVAYSLARSSGGKEVLNRKKMNSIIRKLHLVAMQLHSLVSHLYCVKGQATCKEVDSLPVALNNSHFERKMGVYKSRLKLVVPHKYQQQTQQQQTSASEPAEELLRDTYEFFPELLLCVDIWGYNYRESQAKRNNSKSLLGDQLAGSGALFPLGFFRRVESLAFDFEHDSNGLLRCICDELLNIVCLWNDFKWTDNLETVALDRVVSFETDVTASIVKILELYAHHLQALWAVRLLDEPEQLRSVHFTQLNAYYSDRSQGSLNTAGSQPGDGLNPDTNTVDRLVADEIVEQRLAEEYWNRKVTALSVHNPDDDAMEVDDGDPNSAQLLSAEAISSWDQQTLVSYLLRWSDVYAIRSDVNALSAVTNHMLKHEVHKYRFMSGNGNAEPIGSKPVVDPATRHLLAAVSRAQMLIRDALIGSEKLALHSASNQLPDERKHSIYAETGEASGAAQDTSPPSNKAAEVTPYSNDVAHNNAASDPEPCLNDEQANESNAADSHAIDAQEDVNLDAQEQPELKDLVQLLAVTKQDMQELCGHRPRSARMREKVQTQSLQLARQTVEIFRNIRNMYESQRR
ncbi:hypothetical protein JG688_00014657 [Phytophthora aleatoria]|uniref:Uncharacterized protein n=1 Tax=Phytophthora aleatoria TaxID=2496075 RepID=A0A8J5IWR2_9STRA|nr:hypothetical protein JG688_00014657 [Phytophthora aleatoria]